MAKDNKKIRIFSALEVANICGVVNQTAINWIKNKYLKAFITPGGQYRVYADDLFNFLHSRDMRVPDELKTILEEQLKQNRLLIVEDDTSLNDLLMRYFRKKEPDSEIFQATDGFEAGRIVSEQKPGVIILDIGLPGIDGRKLCRRIKSDTSLGNPIVIAITGLDDPNLETQILKDGADAFIAKPFKPTALSEKIDELMKEKAG